MNEDQEMQRKQEPAQENVDGSDDDKGTPKDTGSSSLIADDDDSDHGMINGEASNSSKYSEGDDEVHIDTLTETMPDPVDGSVIDEENDPSKRNDNKEEGYHLLNESSQDSAANIKSDSGIVDEKIETPNNAQHEEDDIDVSKESTSTSLDANDVANVSPGDSTLPSSTALLSSKAVIEEQQQSLTSSLCIRDDTNTSDAADGDGASNEEESQLKLVEEQTNEGVVRKEEAQPSALTEEGDYHVALKDTNCIENASCAGTSTPLPSKADGVVEKTKPTKGTSGLSKSSCHSHESVASPEGVSCAEGDSSSIERSTSIRNKTSSSKKSSSKKSSSKKSSSPKKSSSINEKKSSSKEKKSKDKKSSSKKRETSSSTLTSVKLEKKDRSSSSTKTKKKSAKAKATPSTSSGEGRKLGSSSSHNPKRSKGHTSDSSSLSKSLHSSGINAINKKKHDSKPPWLRPKKDAAEGNAHVVTRTSRRIVSLDIDPNDPNWKFPLFAEPTSIEWLESDIENEIAERAYESRFSMPKSKKPQLRPGISGYDFDMILAEEKDLFEPTEFPVLSGIFGDYMAERQKLARRQARLAIRGKMSVRIQRLARRFLARLVYLEKVRLRNMARKRQRIQEIQRLIKQTNELRINELSNLNVEFEKRRVIERESFFENFKFKGRKEMLETRKMVAMKPQLHRQSKSLKAKKQELKIGIDKASKQNKKLEAGIGSLHVESSNLKQIIIRESKLLEQTNRLCMIESTLRQVYERGLDRITTRLHHACNEVELVESLDDMARFCKKRSLELTP